MGIEPRHIRIIRTVDLEEDYIDGLRDMLASRTTWGDDAPISRDMQEHLMANAKERYDKLVDKWKEAQDNLRNQPRVNPGQSKQSVNHGHMIYANVNLMLARKEIGGKKWVSINTGSAKKLQT